MARQNLSATRVKPETSELLTLHVVRREQISPNFARVTLGGGDVDRFTPMGFDQWFRLFIPVSDPLALTRLPQKLGTLSYLRYLAIAKTERPVLRNYSVRAWRADGPEGPEIDVDFVLHGTPGDGTAGPAATWAQTCAPGDTAAILDEGLGFNPPDGLDRVRLVADETGLPAVAGILASLPAAARGEAIVELPSSSDRQDVVKPDGVDLTWLPRPAGAAPGRTALAAATELGAAPEPFYGWVVGEQALATSMRRHWVSAGTPKEHVMFCGYYRAAKGH